ncbi:MAG: hypothetical protein EBT03_10380 [Betaproteobacteria bacterium]|nr:hypothetical protein [Betaproteobacteria bacterium]
MNVQKGDSQMKITTAGCVIAVLVMVFACTAYSQDKADEKKPIAPAGKLEEGWDQIDERLVFLFTRLATLEASLDAVDLAIAKASGKKGAKVGEARRADANNQMMDRKGGGPMRWDTFYGTTAEKFFYHPTDRNTSYHTMTVLGQQSPYSDNQVEPGVPSRQGLPVQQRPPQFDYIYRANETAKDKAEAEAAALGEKIDALAERKQQLEADQCKLWCEIAFRAIQLFDLDQKPLIHFEPVVQLGDKKAERQAQAMKAAVLFMQAALSIITNGESDQGRTFASMKPVIAASRKSLSTSWLKLAVDSSKKGTPEAQFAALAKKLDDTSKNLSDSYIVALEGDEQGDRRQKELGREQLQQSLVRYAQIILALDEMIMEMRDQWQIEIDPDKPLLSTDSRQVQRPAMGDDDRPQNAGLDVLDQAVAGFGGNDQAAALPDKVDQKLLKKMFGAAKADYKNKVLTLTYDFKKSDQLKDFDQSTGVPQFGGNGTIRVNPGDKLTHKGTFTAGSIECRINVHAGRRNVLNLGACRVWFQDYDFRLLGVREEAIIGKFARNDHDKAFVNMRVSQENRRTTLEVVSATNRKDCAVVNDNAPPFQVTFDGDRHPLTIGPLTIRAVPEPAWWHATVRKFE